MDLTVTGAEELYAVGKRLRGADKALRKELLKGIRGAAKPLNVAARSNALAVLPKRGGLNRLVARSRMSIQTKTARNSVGVRLKATNTHDIRSMDRGRLRHPVWGNRERWVNQAIKPGWYTDPLKEGRPVVQPKIIEAMRHTAAQIEKG